jgi:uncharacterized protein YqjF (DUF2071 family)
MSTGPAEDAPPPPPPGPWVLRMRWVDLLFAHWPFEPDVLRPLVPEPLELDTFDGRAWLGIVPFVMEDTSPRGLPAVPRLSRFPELNVRTYATYRGRPGVWFLSLDARSRPTVWGARRFFHLPYAFARMRAQRQGQVIDYRSERDQPSVPPARFRATYQPTGPAAHASPGSLEAWLTDRWRLFALDPDGRVERTEIRHPRWPLQPAAATLDASAMAAVHGLTLPDVAPHLLFAGRVDVRGWWPRRAPGERAG